MNFTQLPNGLSEGFVILKKCEEKKTKNGSFYLDLVIADKTGEMSAKWWDYTPNGLFNQEMIVKIRGQVEQYNGKDQFRVSQMRPASDNDSYELSDLVPASEIDGSQLFDMIMKRVNAFSDSELQAIVSRLLSEHKSKLITYPAALRLHHAMVGGLLYHTMSIVRIAEEICKIYDNINKDLLLSGIILHDIAKTWELEAGPSGLAKGYTAEGELLGHLVMGAIAVENAAKELGISGEKVTLLEHMLISHHGVPEYGSPIRPMFLEAQLLSSLDTLDATIFEFNNALSNINTGEMTDRQWALDNRKLYKHSLSAPEHKVDFGE